MSKAEEAFSRAAQCADQAQAARDEETRAFFNRLRDSGCEWPTTIKSPSRWRLTPRHLTLPGLRGPACRLMRNQSDKLDTSAAYPAGVHAADRKPDRRSW